jgi:hypothetical protein
MFGISNEAFDRAKECFKPCVVCGDELSAAPTARPTTAATAAARVPRQANISGAPMRLKIAREAP